MSTALLKFYDKITKEFESKSSGDTKYSNLSSLFLVPIKKLAFDNGIDIKSLTYLQNYLASCSLPTSNRTELIQALSKQPQALFVWQSLGRMSYESRRIGYQALVNVISKKSHFSPNEITNTISIAKKFLSPKESSHLKDIIIDKISEKSTRNYIKAMYAYSGKHETISFVRSEWSNIYSTAEIISPNVIHETFIDRLREPLSKAGIFEAERTFFATYYCSLLLNTHSRHSNNSLQNSYLASKAGNILWPLCTRHAIKSSSKSLEYIYSTFEKKSIKILLSMISGFNKDKGTFLILPHLRLNHLLPFVLASEGIKISILANSGAFIHNLYPDEWLLIPDLLTNQVFLSELRRRLANKHLIFLPTDAHSASPRFYSYSSRMGVARYSRSPYVLSKYFGVPLFHSSVTWSHDCDKAIAQILRLDGKLKENPLSFVICERLFSLNS